MPQPRRRSSRLLALETLEHRIVAAADLAASLVTTPLADWVVPGQALTIAADVANLGDEASAGYTLEYRLSVDAAISADDLLLGSSSQVGLIASQSVSLSPQSFTIPTSVVKGVYYVGVSIVPAGIDADAANNAAAEATATSVLLTSLSGTVKYNTASRAVALRSHLGGSTPIFDDRATWIVIHGRNSYPSVAYLAGLAGKLDGYTPNDQVLMLDWSAAAASGWIGGAGENYIIPVGAWMASALSTYGLEPSELNLVGHSWGAYIAAETAERVPADTAGLRQVNSIVALDPAADYPGGSYNPNTSGQVNFARNSKLSWALYASGGSYGNATTAKTAHESFVVKGSDHTKLVSVFTDIVGMNYDGRQLAGATGSVVAQMQVQRLLTPATNTTWVSNTYNNSGSKVTTGGVFEAVIQAATGGIKLKTLRYLSAATLKEVSLTV